MSRSSIASKYVELHSHTKGLPELKMFRGSIHEVIISTYLNGVPYATPIGIVDCGSYVLKARVYKGTTLWEACRRSNLFILNICLDPVVFVQSILAKSELQFFDSKLIKQPAIAGCEGYIECLKLGLVDESPSYGTLYLQVIDFEILALAPYTRCLGLAIEILIELTRIRARVKGCREAAMKLDQLVKDFHRLCSGSAVDTLINTLVRECGNDFIASLKS